MSERSFPAVVLDRFRRNERGLALAWLIAAGLLALAVVVGPIREAALDRAQAAVRRWDGRWTERLHEGERLVAVGRFVEAAAYLERLDRIHPARNVRHARDQERERVLRLLGQSYEALDRRAWTIATYQRLVAFDPKNYRNYFALAEAADRLLSRATIAPEARDAYAAALDIFPAHLPSVRGYIRYYLDRGEFAPVVENYERYLNAHLVQQIEVRLADEIINLAVLVDGHVRDFEVQMSTELSADDVLTIATGGFAAAVKQVAIRPAARAGIAAQIEAVPLDLTNPHLVEFEPVDHDTYRALGADSAFGVPVPAKLDSVDRIHLRLALFKPVDRELWTAVAKSFHNLLDDSGHLAAAMRTVTLESTHAADLVMEQLVWAQRGVLQSPYDENQD